MSHGIPGFGAALHRLAAYQFLAPTLAGESVLEIGCGEGDGLRQLWALGATTVVGLDRDVRRAGRRVTALEDQVTVRSVRPPRLGLRGQTFSRVLVPDARWLLRHERLLEECVGALAPEGWLILRAESGDHPDVRDGVPYETLLEMVEEEFETVRVLGQSAFVGYSVVELSEVPPESLELTLDGTLLGGEVEEVGTYLVIASHGPVELAALGYGIVQVPSAGDEALPHWWDSLAEDAPAAASTPEPAPAPDPAPELAPDPVPEPAPDPAPIDLLSYTDAGGGRVSRWRWPRQG